MTSSTPAQHITNVTVYPRRSRSIAKTDCYRWFSIALIMVATIWNNNIVYGAPAKLDELVKTPTTLNLQPPIFEASYNEDNDDTKKTIDSYGNPIESLKPIDTPDGRKVVSAQGLQFEIPNYASGITELRKPSDDLLPPFVDKIGGTLGSSNAFERKPSTTTTTTTTTTTQAPIVDGNPFEPTIPPWLKDFDYPDVGPGVPFIYNPDDDEEPVDKDIQPPSSENVVDTTKAIFVNSPTTASAFLNSQNSQSSTKKLSSTSSTSSTSLTASSSSPTSSASIPSKVTLPLPSIQIKQDEDNTLKQQAPSVFVAPTTEDNNASKKTSSNSNTNFAARLDSNTAQAPTRIPLGADRESFPPFNTPLPAKTTFSKSEDGKVITNNVFLNGAASGSSTKSFVASSTTASSIYRQKDTSSFPGVGFTKSPTASTSFNELTTLAGASGFVPASVAAASNTKYTGSFGGPPGVLSSKSNSNGLITGPTASTIQSFGKPFTVGEAANSQQKFTGRFGGPPGVLTPYDNAKSS